MATIDSSGSVAAASQDGEPEAFDHWSEDRIDAACNASFQVEQMLYALRREVERGGDLGRSLLISNLVRLKELNGVMMSLLIADESRETAEMSKVVFGEWPGDDA